MSSLFFQRRRCVSPFNQCCEIFGQAVDQASSLKICFQSHVHMLALKSHLESQLWQVSFDILPAHLISSSQQARTRYVVPHVQSTDVEDSKHELEYCRQIIHVFGSNSHSRPMCVRACARTPGLVHARTRALTCDSLFTSSVCLCLSCAFAGMYRFEHLDRHSYVHISIRIIFPAFCLRMLVLCVTGFANVVLLYHAICELNCVLKARC